MRLGGGGAVTIMRTKRSKDSNRGWNGIERSKSILKEKINERLE